MKKFNQVIKVAKVKAYSEESKSLLVLAMMNSVVDFTPVLAPNGTVDAGATTAEYLIQVPKRVKSQLVANPNTGATADALAALDKFSKTDWETIGVATGVLKGIGVKTGINEKFDADNMGEAHAKSVSGQVENIAVSRIESLLELILNNATVKATATALGADIFTQLSNKADEIMMKVTDVKHMSTKPIIIMHPTVVTKVAKEMGTAFTQEVAVYNTGLKTKFSINGIPVIKEYNLNKYDGTAADGTDRYGAIIIDADSIALKKKSEQKAVSVDLGLTKYDGTFFYDVQAFIDEERAALFTFDAKTAGVTVSKKAND